MDKDLGVAGEQPDRRARLELQARQPLFDHRVNRLTTGQPFDDHWSTV